MVSGAAACSAEAISVGAKEPPIPLNDRKDREQSKEMPVGSTLPLTKLRINIDNQSSC